MQPRMQLERKSVLIKLKYLLRRNPLQQQHRLPNQHRLRYPFRPHPRQQRPLRLNPPPLQKLRLLLQTKSPSLPHFHIPHLHMQRLILPQPLNPRSLLFLLINVG